MTPHSAVQVLVAKWRDTVAEGGPTANAQRGTRIFNQTLLSCADELEAALAEPTSTHITWDKQGRRLVNGVLGSEHRRWRARHAIEVLRSVRWDTVKAFKLSARLWRELAELATIVAEEIEDAHPPEKET